MPGIDTRGAGKYSTLWKLNGMPAVAGVITCTTAKSNFDTATSFLTNKATVACASVLATHTLVFTPSSTLIPTPATITLTAVAGAPANENQFSIDGATDADDAAALATAINAHSTLRLWVRATVASATVTLTALPGCPATIALSQGVGATFTFAGKSGFGPHTLAGKTIVVQADAAIFIRFLKNSSDTAVAQTLAGSDMYLDAYQSLELTVHPDYNFLSCIPFSGSSSTNVRVSVKL